MSGRADEETKELPTSALPIPSHVESSDHVGGDAPPPRAGGFDTVVDALKKHCPKCGKGFPASADVCSRDGEALVDAGRMVLDPFVGSTIHGRYVVEGILGAGGMGTVYEASHLALGKRFAMKILRPDVAFERSAVERFVREARLAASLKHENLADVSDFGEITRDEIPSLGDRTVPFFVMELLRGRTLGEILRDEQRLEVAFASEIFRQTASGLGAAHAAGIIHRDLKPDNVFVVEDGKRRYVKLLDFGIAKVNVAAKLTKPNMVFGTPTYMSPEQASGGELDVRSDVYSLGVVMYEALSGKVPFEADTEMGLVTKHHFEQPEPLERVAPSTPRLAELAPIIMRCLEKDPAARFQTAADLIQAIDGRMAVAPLQARGLSLRDATPAVAEARARMAEQPKTKPRRAWVGPALVFALGCIVVVAFVALMKGSATVGSTPTSSATVAVQASSTPAEAASPPVPTIDSSSTAVAAVSAAPTASSTPVASADTRGLAGNPLPSSSTATPTPAASSKVIDTW